MASCPVPFEHSVTHHFRTASGTFHGSRPYLFTRIGDHTSFTEETGILHHARSLAAFYRPGLALTRHTFGFPRYCLRPNQSDHVNYFKQFGPLATPSRDQHRIQGRNCPRECPTRNGGKSSSRHQQGPPPQRKS